jgi:hypothetical protein
MACAGWGIAPNPPLAIGAARVVAVARLALPQVEARRDSAPDAAAAAQLGRAAFLDHAAALISPTGQLGITGAISAELISPLETASDLDTDYLAVVAAVRPVLARLEAWQLTTTTAFAAWANRGADPWQTDSHDTRPLVAVWADGGVDFAANPPTVAAVELDRFEEVIPSASQRTGAAFGFDAPASRAPQAILLAVPPSPGTPLDLQTLAQILVETRELAHARMARPVDLDEEFWGLAPTGLLPASGSLAIPLEARG